MESIAELTTINYLSILLGILVIMFGIKEIIEIFTYFKKKFRIKTGIEEDKETLEDRVTLLERHDKWQYNEISKISSGVDEIKKQLLNKDIDDYRYEILSFCTGLTNNQKYNKESFDHILQIHKKYHAILDTHGLTNGQVAASMEVIEEVYRDKLKNGF